MRSNSSKLRLSSLGDKRSQYLRQEIIWALATSKRGHIASALSLVEILRVVYDHFLRFNPKKPQWKDRDRLILSKGHGCLALYALLADKGYFSREMLSTFCLFEGMLGGHPDARKVPGVEASTGALGHGLAIGVGHALAARLQTSSYRTFVVISDGECDEGSTWEAALHIAKHALTNLTIIIDYNRMQSYSSTHEVLELEPFAAKWKSFGFRVFGADGHNVMDLKKALRLAVHEKEKPAVVIAKTVKGKGISFMEQNASWHHKAKITDEEMILLRQAVGLDRVSSLK